MTASYTFDFFTSLDGFGTATGDWTGYWGKQGPELLEHRLAVYDEPQRMVFGGTTYREFVQMLATSDEQPEVLDPWVTRMLASAGDDRVVHADGTARLAGRDRRERRRRRDRLPAQAGVRPCRCAPTGACR